MADMTVKEMQTKVEANAVVLGDLAKQMHAADAVLTDLKHQLKVKADALAAAEEKAAIAAAAAAAKPAALLSPASGVPAVTQVAGLHKSFANKAAFSAAVAARKGVAVMLDKAMVRGGASPAVYYATQTNATITTSDSRVTVA
jgi:hypothetical protein